LNACNPTPSQTAALGLGRVFTQARSRAALRDASAARPESSELRKVSPRLSMGECSKDTRGFFLGNDAHRRNFCARKHTTFG
jgi:hypothetical protein